MLGVIIHICKKQKDIFWSQISSNSTCNLVLIYISAFPECLKNAFQISACSQLRKSWHKWFFDPVLYQPPLARDHLCRKHMYLIQPTTMSVFHVNSQKPIQWENTAFFFTSKYAFFNFKICIYSHYASKNDSTIFF